MQTRHQAAALVLTLMLLPYTAASAKIHADKVVFFAPEPISTDQKLSQIQLVRIAAQAFAMQSWRITDINRADGYIDAELPVRVHVARLRITVEDGTFHFEYRQSDKIPHGWMSKGDEWVSQKPESESAREVIHPNYVDWVNKVHRSITSLLRIRDLPDE